MKTIFSATTQVKSLVFVLSLWLVLACVVEANEESCSQTSDSDAAPTTCDGGGNGIPTKALANGVQMPQLSLGVAHYYFGDVPFHKDNQATFKGFTPEKAYRQIELALQNGIRSFDTALMYGTQKHVGRVLGKWWASGKLTSRDDIFITSKVFHAPFPGFGLASNHPVNLHSMTPQQITEMVETHIERCMNELGVGYIDLLLLHWPSGPQDENGQPEEGISRQRRIAAWKVFETFYERGWIRAIGVSNYSDKHLRDLMTDGATIKPMMNQIEASPYLQFDRIVSYCKENNIGVQAYSPLGSGVNNVKDDPVLKAIASNHNKDVGQVAFRYLIQKGYTSVAYLTTNPKRMVTNQQIFDFELSDDEMKTIDSLNRPDGSFGLPSPHDLP